MHSQPPHTPACRLSSSYHLSTAVPLSREKKLAIIPEVVLSSRHQAIGHGLPLSPSSHQVVGHMLPWIGDEQQPFAAMDRLGEARRRGRDAKERRAFSAAGLCGSSEEQQPIAAVDHH
ncbi:hypothetical protein PR202_gb24288 [Eleusine coracana subsp. coracana]|uniref:Uncharacterized protein n=1 Tax=Eleusine coracana subsp. coracana TaxID=191504 RepID=A0AAV5FM62_ELECO|nr:hypothetical protein PR202_gb24288 [Eleusine coracana subsp. coracana]